MTAISVSTTITTRRRQLVNVRQRSLLVAKTRVPTSTGTFPTHTPLFVGLLIVMSAFWMLTGLSSTTTAWDLMLPLAITSTDRMVMRLGARRWKALHRLTYLIVPAGVPSSALASLPLTV